MRPLLLYSDTQSFVSFSAIPKRVTLHDLEWLFLVEFCFRAGLADSDRATLKQDKKAVLSQGNRAMPQLFFSV